MEFSRISSQASFCRNFTLQYNLYKWDARDGEYPDTTPFPGYNLFQKG